MKTTMKITGNLSLAIIMFGTVINIMHWPGAGYLLALGFLLVCAVFFPLAVYINYKYNQEKKNPALHISLLISGIVYMLGVVFKIQHWPGSGPLLTVGYLSFVAVVLPLLLYSKLKNAKQKRDKQIYLLGTVALLIFILSGMFKIMHWPGPTIMMILGGILLVTAFLPLYTWRRIQLEGKITGQFIFTIILTMFLVLFTSLLALNVPTNYLAVFVDQAKDDIEISQFLETRNSQKVHDINQMPDSLYSESKAKHIKKEADNVCKYINNLMVSLVNEVDQVNAIGKTDQLKDPARIPDKGNTEISKSIMLGIQENGKAHELKETLKQFKTVLSTEFDTASEIVQLSVQLIDLSDHTKWKKNMTWERYHFENTPLISVISTLNQFQSSVRILESNALEVINNKNK